MNLKNLEQLAIWLEDGAPHIVFNMNFGLEPLDFLVENEPSRVANALAVERDAKGLGDCGTVCCIAGYAAHKLATSPLSAQTDSPWPEIREVALQTLGLPNNGDFYGHDLFDSELCPDECTTAEAAVAVRKVMKGEAPWT